MRIFLIFLLVPLQLFSQDIHGVWTGTIYNDSTRKYIPYEIAISETRGKLTGFSHTTFIDDNKEVAGVKTLKIKQKGTKILIEDDELIYNNYLFPPPKGVKMFSTLSITFSPSGEYLVGAFSTNRTKEYASATGTINLKKKEKITETKLIAKLDELNLSNSLSFIQSKNNEKKDVAVVPVPIKNNKPSAQPTQQKDVAVLSKTKKEPVKIEKDENLIDINEDTIDYKVDVIETEDVAREKQKKQLVKNQPVLTKKAEIITPQPKTVITEIKTLPVIQPKKDAAITSIKNEKKTEIQPQPTEKPAITSTRPKDNSVITQPRNKKTKEIIIEQPTTKNSEVVSVPKEKSKEPIIPVYKPVQNSNASAPVISYEELAKRKIETIRTVDFKSDSLILTLYDNGVVDGDTVSVIMNGKIIMPRQGLSTKAISKTVYITPDLGDSLQLIMYAENLGSIPPNTGLLIIKDGEDSYQIRFAGDLQKNSAIILRRKHN
ncbi:MAG: hypothetical protein JWN83_1637 [Chitinophagaceae bacterium]|nr:hypothetical protein [Chitinophagaceae bacterium]